MSLPPPAQRQPRSAGQQLVAIAALAGLAAGCSLAPDRGARDTAADAGLVERSPLTSTRFMLVDGEDVVGQLQVIRARHEDTFVDIARAYNLGYDELVDANPGVDPWLPGEGTRIVLPTRHILPDAPREGIVINLAAKRLFYYPEHGAGEAPFVVTHPIGIGREGWETPLGNARIIGKTKDPSWYPPASVRQEHAEAGDPLPARVPPGPDNPLGGYALRLDLPGYLMHGTNKPAGVGMRVSHGCIRMFPEDIEWLFGRVAIGVPVTIVDQPLRVGWYEDELFIEMHAPLEEHGSDWEQAAQRLVLRTLSARYGRPGGPDADELAAIVAEHRGIPVALGNGGSASAIAAAALVKNVVSYAAAGETVLPE